MRWGVVEGRGGYRGGGRGGQGGRTHLTFGVTKLVEKNLNPNWGFSCWYGISNVYFWTKIP